MAKSSWILSVLLMSWGATVAQAASKFDQSLMKAHQSAKTYESWVVGMAKEGYAGDEKYFAKLFKNTPDLVKNKALPQLNYDKGVFTLREGKSEVRFELSDRAGHFTVNGKSEVSFLPTDLTSQKLKKVLHSLSAQKSVNILLMPVAWAQSQGQPTRMSVALTAMVEKASHAASMDHSRQMADRLTEASRVINKGGKACINEIQSFEEEAASEGLDVQRMMCAPVGRSGVMETQILMTQSKEAVILRMTDAGFSVAGNGISGEYTSKPSAKGEEFHPEKDSSQELMFRYMVFATPSRRNLCQKCAGEVAAYEQAVALVRQGAMDRSQPVKAKSAVE